MAVWYASKTFPAKVSHHSSKMSAMVWLRPWTRWTWVRADAWNDFSSSYWQDSVKELELDPEQIKQAASKENVTAKLREYSVIMSDMEVYTDIGFIKDNRELLLIKDQEEFQKKIVRKFP